jgi:two-component system chemotaxis sensor kinase CheA
VSHDCADDDLIAEMLPAFIEEANEQVAAFEQLLLELEDEPDHPERLDALFRCAHTVKGSAGLFGLDRVVAFTHHVETLLDRLRDGLLQLTPALSTLLLRSNDTIRELVATAQLPDDEACAAERQALVLQLQQACGAGMASAAAVTVAGHAAGTAAASAVPMAATTGSGWRIQANFGPEVFRNGMDPLAIIHYLADHGELDAASCDRSKVPPLEGLDPETCHLHLGCELRPRPGGRLEREEIEHAFEFVQEDCDLHIEPLSAEAGSVDGVGGGIPVVDVADAAAPAIAVQARLQAAVAELSQGLRAAPVTGKSPGNGVGNTKAGGPAASRPKEGAVDDGGYIRVHANRLDEVINLLGELVIAGAGASQLARQTRQRGLIEANQRISRLIEGIRNSTLKLRMVPIGDTFARFRRVVRDTAAELGKEVALEIVGGDTELDKAVVERIADPLMHLVRNGLDHGLETAEQRIAAGKPPQGRLTLSACHESGSVLIRIVDDGRGIQRDKVLQRAWQRGLVPDGVVPPEEDILRLIFEPGFSTAEQVTNLSGRGVGMDVVRSNIEALRGSIQISSTPGQGSCMEIRLPLTLAIIDGFLVGVGASRFIFPLESVVEVISTRPESMQTDPLGRGCVELRGRLLPVVDLRQLYDLDPAEVERHSVVVVRCGSRQVGVRVDTLLGQHQTVIKPLGRLLRSLRGIAGSSILGSGEVALIIDAEALGQIVASGRHAPSARSASSATAADPSFPQLAGPGRRDLTEPSSVATADAFSVEGNRR